MKKSHQQIGKELELFIFEDKVGYGGLPIFLPKGEIILSTLENYIKSMEKRFGFKSIKTPLIGGEKFFSISGHLMHYYDLMFTINEENPQIALRPVTCPYHFLTFESQIHSYKEMPIRFSEFTYLFRKVKSGSLRGLFRTSQIRIGDGHIFCTPSNVEEELYEAIEFIKIIAEKLDLKDDLLWRLSLRNNTSSKFEGDKSTWDLAEKWLKSALDLSKVNYESVEGVAAFYGPKIDVYVLDLLGRDEAIFTIQLDLQLALKFDLNYIDEMGQKKHPIIIHRSAVSSFERLLAIILEKTDGLLPFWLAPIQVHILLLNEHLKETSFFKDIEKEFVDNEIRYYMDLTEETLSKKIVNARKSKVPFWIIIGQHEIDKNTFAINNSSGKVCEGNLSDIIDYFNRLK